MALSKNHVIDVCLFGMGSDECRYIDAESTDNSGQTVFLCKKKSLDRKLIDEEIQEFEQECKKKGIDPKREGLQLGDNCSGFLPLKALTQGYDV